MKKILLITTIILSCFVNKEVMSQMPVYIYDANPEMEVSVPIKITEVTPQVRFWVTNFENMNSSSTLFTKDETLIEIAKELVLEEKRHNQWIEDYTKIGAQASKELARDLATELLLQTQNKMLDFAKEGFNKDKESGFGNPAYVKDQEELLKKMDKAEVGLMFNNEFKSDKINEIVKEEVQKVIGKEASRKELKDKIKGHEDYIDKDATKDLKKWEDWYYFSLPENNPIGSLIIVNEELRLRQEEQKQAIINELNQGKGALSYKKCQKYKIDDDGKEEKDGEPFYGDPIYEYDLPEGTETTETSKEEDDSELTEENAGGYQKTVCVIVTPSSIISSNTEEQDNSDLRTAENDSISSDGVQNSDEAIRKSLQEKLIVKLEKGLLSDDLGNFSSSTIENILQPNINNLSQASTSLKNPFSTKDIYNPQNNTSPYNPSTGDQAEWFDYWGVGEFDPLGIFFWDDYLYNDTTTDNTSKCPEGKIETVFGTCI